MKRDDVVQALNLARKVEKGLSSFPLSLAVPRRYVTWVKAICDVLRDVLPLVPE